MSDERLARHWSTTKAYDALQRFIEGKHRLHIPVQESDEDRIIAAVIDERDALREEVAALRPLLDASPLWVYRADDVGILACKHCDGMEEGDVFIHHPRCPWQVAKRSHDSTTEPKN